MVIFSLGLCYHVIHIYFNLLMHHVMKQRYHCSLIRYPDVLQPKRHDLVAKGSSHSQEYGLFHIFRSHPDLIIARESVHKGKQKVLGRIIY